MRTHVSYISVALFILILPGLCLASGDTKYIELFYPNGMPVKSGPLGEGQTVYNYYDEAETQEENLLFILWFSPV